MSIESRLVAQLLKEVERLKTELAAANVASSNASPPPVGDGTMFPATGDGVSLSGTKTCIFGGSDGMGKASASAVLLRGGQVQLIARTMSKLEAVRTELVKARACDGSMVTTASVDCFDPSAVESFFAGVAAGSVHHLVVTLGPAVEGSDDIFGKSTLELVKKQFGKFNAAWAVVKYGAPKLADGGSITLFSGALSRNISKGASCLASVNAAVECLSKCAAKELAPRVRVNCVSPGLTRTSAVTGGMSADQAEGMFTGYGKSIPAGRSGNAEDLGHAVAFLTTNCFMTGQVIDCSGGSLM